jgi:hypothetical protein
VDIQRFEGVGCLDELCTRQEIVIKTLTRLTTKQSFIIRHSENVGTGLILLSYNDLGR